MGFVLMKYLGYIIKSIKILLLVFMSYNALMTAVIIRHRIKKRNDHIQHDATVFDATVLDRLQEEETLFNGCDKWVRHAHWSKVLSTYIPIEDSPCWRWHTGTCELDPDSKRIQPCSWPGLNSQAELDRIRVELVSVSLRIRIQSAFNTLKMRVCHG